VAKLQKILFQNYLLQKHLKEIGKTCKAKEQALRAEVELEKAELRSRQEANRKKKEENAKKSEIVQQVRGCPRFNSMNKKYFFSEFCLKFSVFCKLQQISNNNRTKNLQKKVAKILPACNTKKLGRNVLLYRRDLSVQRFFFAWTENKKKFCRS
jgi:hypothetical protein